MSPVTFVDGQTKDYLKGKLHEKRLLLWRSCVEASLYCAVFHEVKRFLRDKTAKHRQAVCKIWEHQHGVCSQAHASGFWSWVCTIQLQQLQILSTTLVL